MINNKIIIKESCTNLLSSSRLEGYPLVDTGRLGFAQHGTPVGTPSTRPTDAPSSGTWSPLQKVLALSAVLSVSNVTANET